MNRVQQSTFIFLLRLLFIRSSSAVVYKIHEFVCKLIAATTVKSAIHYIIHILIKHLPYLQRLS